MGTCSFLGYIYCYSQELFDLHAVYEDFSRQQANLFAILENVIRTKDRPGVHEGKESDEIVDAFHSSANHIVKSLCDKGIVSYTVSDFFDKNSAYSKYEKFAKDTLDAYLKILLNTLEDYMSNAMQARSSAVSTITGTGTGIITNSIASALLFDAMEYRAVNEQMASAEAMYKKKIRNINNQSDRRQAEMEQNYKFHTWLPSVQELIYEFVSYNLNLYLQILHETGQLKSDATAQIDTKRSTALLKNCSLTDNKQPVLVEAFQADPFNLEVYTTTFQLGFFTSVEYKTLELFGLSASFSKFLRAEKKKMVSPTSEVALEDRTAFLSRLYAIQERNLDLQSFIVGELEPYLATKINWYKTTILSPEVRKKWVKENVAYNLNELGVLSSEEIEEKIKGKLPLEEKKSSMGRLIEENLITDKDLVAVREEAFKNYSDYCNEFQELYRNYKVLSDEYDAKAEPLKKQILNCEETLHKCGIFEFKKKRLLQDESLRLNKELDDLKPQANKINEIKIRLNNF